MKNDVIGIFEPCQKLNSFSMTCSNVKQLFYDMLTHTSVPKDAGETMIFIH